VLSVNVPSLIDPSLAPEGHAAITLIYLLPHEEAVTWRREAEEYRERKKQVGDELIKLAETAIPDLRRHILYRQEATPATMERYAWTSDGAIYGLEMNQWHPPARTPLRGLFLAGAGTRDRPGVADVVASGAKAAMEAIKDLTETERAGRASITRALSET
jgi:phytoene dehydrogenase-like protein